jgi:hypothetical protein
MLRHVPRRLPVARADAQSGEGEVSVYISETIADLRALLEDVRRQAEDVGYGYFPGGDPRLFSPDPEASTEAEREQHRVDCERAEQHLPPLTRTGREVMGEGDRAIDVHFAGYGLGTYTMEDPAMQDIAERLERSLDQLERLASESP